MIRINLLGERIDYTRAIALHLLSFSGALFGLIVLLSVVQAHISSERDEKRAEAKRLETELAELKKITAEVEGLEIKRKVLKEKIITIANLKAKKHGPVHVLDELNSAIPERSWITSIKERDGALELQGLALDNQTIADFMRTIDAAKYLGTSELVVSSQEELNSVKIKQFTVRAQLKNPFVIETSKQDAAVAMPLGAKERSKPKAKAEKKEI